MQDIKSAAPLVSVNMPVYNCEDYVGAAIQSVLEQTYSNFELIIVDDGSNDQTWKILYQYSQRDQRISLYRNSGNQGISISRNKCVDHSSGKYIASMDADDIALPNRLEKQVAFMEQNHEIGIVGAYYQIIDKQGVKGSIVKPPTSPSQIRSHLLLSNSFGASTVMFRRPLLEQVGHYETMSSTAEDYALWSRFAQVTKLANLPEVLLLYRVHDRGVSQVHSERQNARAVQVVYRNLTGFLGREVPLEAVTALYQPLQPGQPPTLLKLAVDLLCDVYFQDAHVLDEGGYSRPALRWVIGDKLYWLALENWKISWKYSLLALAWAFRISPRLPRMNTIQNTFQMVMERIGLNTGWLG